MKTLVIAEKDKTKEILSLHLRPLGFDIIHYHNPIKAMDNIDEIEPDLVLFSAEDFPRHWKPFLRLLRASRTKEQTVFIILRGEHFSFEEASKASHLGVNGIISETFDSREKNRLQELFIRYKMIKEERLDTRYVPESFDNIEFLITHPINYSLITGTILDFSLEGLRYRPDNPSLTQDLARGVVLPHCSLKIEDLIFSLECKVVRHNDVLAMQFLNPEEDLKETILTFIDKKSERELHRLLNRSA